jgi:elongation factor P
MWDERMGPRRGLSGRRARPESGADAYNEPGAGGVCDWLFNNQIEAFEDSMAALLEAITVKRKMYFEFENAPYYCLDAEVSTPTARGGQTLVRLKMRNLLTQAVFDKTFKAQEKFKEPDLETVEASYLYSDSEGSYFLDQETFDTLRLSESMIGNALDYLVEGAIVKLNKFNGNPIGLELPEKVELEVTYTEAGAQGDTSGKVTKLARLETGLEIKAPLYIQEGERVKVYTEDGEFAGRA